MTGIERIITGDALEELAELPEAFAHAVVTDPPYGLSFMGRDWDRFSAEEYQDWCRLWAEKAYRVLKPGGHLLAFSSNRTHHRLFSGVENAGFEIRDTVTWHYGNSFPKHTDMFLKPATEFVVVARRPFDGSAADCFEEHGTAYLNIDACRVCGEERPERTQEDGETDRNSLDAAEDNSLQSSGKASGTTTEGRYPSNVVFDEPVADNLDAEIGELSSGGLPAKRDGIGSDRVFGSATGQQDLGQRVETNAGGPSRYYYTSKATEAERTLNGRIDNDHPTVKPMDLMEWLVTLVSRKNQVVVDPFCGTGTTCKAAKELGREWLGIEQDPKWADVARVRCGLSPIDPSHVRSDEDQYGLEEFLAATDGGNGCSQKPETPRPFDVAREANNRVNDLLAETDGAIAEMSFSGAIGYHINVASGESDPEYLWRVALFQALDESVFEMTHVDADTVSGAREQLDRTLTEAFDHFTAERVGDRFEENLQQLIEAQGEVADAE